MSEVYQSFAYGEEIPDEFRVTAQRQEEMMLNSIKWLVTAEIKDHLTILHDCVPCCFAKANTARVMDDMPVDQVQFLVLRMAQMLARAFLRDKPEVLEEVLRGDVGGLA